MAASPLHLAPPPVRLKSWSQILSLMPPSPSAIPASLRWQQWLILGTCSTKILFSDGNVFQMDNHNICTGIRREDSWQTKQNEQGQRNPEKLADLFLGP